VDAENRVELPVGTNK